MLQAGLLWRSYTAPSWFDIRVGTEISWWPSNNGVSSSSAAQLNWVLRSMDLDDILTAFTLSSSSSTENRIPSHLSIVLLMMSVLVIPGFASLMYFPVRILMRHRHFRKGKHYPQERPTQSIVVPQGEEQGPDKLSIPCLLMDILVRLSFFVVWILLFLDLSTSFIRLGWTDTEITVHNQIRSGLAMFALASTCMIVLAVLERLGRFNIPRRVKPPLDPSPYMQEDPDDSDDKPNDTDGQASTEPLLQEQTQLGQAHTETSGQNRGRPRTANNDAGSPSGSFLSRLYKIVVFEAALVSLIILIASFTEPLLTINYGGAISGLLPAKEQIIRLSELPHLLWERGTAAGDSIGMLGILGTALILQVFLIPMVVFLLAIQYWGTGHRKWFESLYPAVNTSTLAICLAVLVPVLDNVPAVLLEQETAGICQDFEVALGEPCLTLESKLGLGAWCWIGFAATLEMFLFLSLLNRES